TAHQFSKQKNALARNAMVAAISHGSAARPKASPSESRSSRSDELVFSRNLCRAMLGDTALMRTPFSTASMALQRVSAITPALAAAECDCECWARQPSTLALLTITPPWSASRKYLRAARVARITDV